MNTTQSVEQQYLTKAQAHIRTGLSERTLDYARARGKIEWYKVGKRVLLKRSSLDAFIEQHRTRANIDKFVDETVREVLGK